MCLLEAFSLQYAIIGVEAIESILTLYTYYREKLEGAVRGKAITIYTLVNRIHVQKYRY